MNIFLQNLANLIDFENILIIASLFYFPAKFIIHTMRLKFFNFLSLNLNFQDVYLTQERIFDDILKFERNSIFSKKLSK